MERTTWLSLLSARRASGAGGVSTGKETGFCTGVLSAEAKSGLATVSWPSEKGDISSSDAIETRGALSAMRPEAGGRGSAGSNIGSGGEVGS